MAPEAIVGGTDTADDEGIEMMIAPESNATFQPGGIQVLVYAYDYFPEVPFRIQEQLQESTVVAVLRRPDRRHVPEIVQPSEYNGYVIEYRMQDDPRVSGITTFLYTRSFLDTSGRYRLLADADVFSIQLNLVETIARRIG